MSSLTKSQKMIIIGVLLLANALGVMSTDLYTPSMPHLPALLATTAELVQLTLALNALAFGLAQLIIGPLADRFGRRPVFLVGMVVFAVVTVGCGLAVTIEQLLLARVLQGVAAAAHGVIVLAVITDIFEERQRVKVMAIYGIVFAVAPAVAPIIGGYIHVLWGWRANFFVISILAIPVLGLALVYLRETGQPDRTALQPRQLGRNYLVLIRERRFITYSLMMALNLGMLFAYITEAPFVLIDLFGVPTQHFGYYHLVMVSCFMLGSVVASQWVKRSPPQQMLKYGMLMTCAGVTLFAAQEFLIEPTRVSFIATFCLLIFSAAPMFAVLPALAMAAAPKGTGTASALFGSVEMLGGGGAALLVLLLHDGTSRPLVVTIIILFALMMLLHLYSEWRVARHAARGS